MTMTMTMTQQQHDDEQSSSSSASPQESPSQSRSHHQLTPVLDLSIIKEEDSKSSQDDEDAVNDKTPTVFDPTQPAYCTLCSTLGHRTSRCDANKIPHLIIQLPAVKKIRLIDYLGKSKYRCHDEKLNTHDDSNFDTNESIPIHIVN